jgi:hypothetical protein
MAVPNTSGTYNFNPSMGESVLYSYGMCGVRRTALTQAHYEDARMATNMMMSAWSARGVNLWAVDLQSLALTQGCATYQVPSNTIVMLDAYYTINPGGGAAQTDRIMNPISRTEYASYPNKAQQGAPTVFWFDRLLSPTVTLWPTPDGQQACFNYYRLRQTQDSTFTNGTSIEIPVYFWDAFSLGLAWRLALIWAPDKAIMLKPLADEAYEYAATQNVESSQMYISPVIGQYFR